MMVINNERLALKNIDLNQKSSGLVYTDFVAGTLNYRRKSANDNRASPMIKALQIHKPVSKTTILDATGGYGIDSFIFACKGYKIILLERDPILYSLLYDAYLIGLQYPDVAPVLQNMKIIHDDAFKYIPNVIEDQIPDIIYLDPMFPSKVKVALSSKEIMIARKLVENSDTQSLLQLAQSYAKERVILKRPIKLDDHPNAIKICHGKISKYEVFMGKFNK